MIEAASFTSVWDGGHALTTSCTVNTETREITDIETADAQGEEFDVLEEQYVTVNGKKYPAVPADSRDENDSESYWYD